MTGCIFVTHVGEEREERGERPLNLVRVGRAVFNVDESKVGQGSGRDPANRVSFALPPQINIMRKVV